MRLFNKSHASLNKLVAENDNMSLETGDYEIQELYKYIAKRNLYLFLVIFFVILVVTMGTMIGISYFSASRCIARSYLDFYPKQTSAIGHMENLQLQQLLSPRFVLDAIPDDVAKSLGISEDVITFEKDFTEAPRFIITALGKNDEQCTARVKAYAEGAIQLYVNTRRRDLGQWVTNIEASEVEITEKLKALDKAEMLLNRSHKVTSLEDEINHLTQLRAEKEIAFREITRHCTKQEELVKKQESQLGSLPAQILEKAGEIADFQMSIDRVTKALNDLLKDGKGSTREAISLKSQLADLQTTFGKYCSETEAATNLSTNDLKKLGTQYKQLLDAKEELQSLLEKKEEAKISLESTEEYINNLYEYLPQYNDILSQRKALKQSSDEAKEVKTCAAYLMTVAFDELVPTRAEIREAQNTLFNIRKTVLALLLTVILTLLICLAITHFDAVRGNISSLKELTFQPGLAVLGKLGGSHDKGERFYFRFKVAMGRRKTVFVQAMPGARNDADVHKEFDVQCALCGQKLLAVEIVDAKTFDPPADANIFAAISYKGDHGWMPLADLTCLSSSEELLLEADLKMLSSDFDIILLYKQGNSSENGLFVAQMSQLCDATMLLFGNGTTPRKYLQRYFSETNSEIPKEEGNVFNKKTVMGALTEQE